MIGLDTNVVIRHLVQDDPVQAPLASAVMDSLTTQDPGFVSAVVLAEITWVLARAYGASRRDIAAAVEGVLRAAEIVVENAPAAYRALAAYRASPSVDFADALIAQTALLAGARETVTFDRRAAQELGLRLLG